MKSMVGFFAARARSAAIQHWVVKYPLRPLGGMSQRMPGLDSNSLCRMQVAILAAQRGSLAS